MALAAMQHASANGPETLNDLPCMPALPCLLTHPLPCSNLDSQVSTLSAALQSLTAGGGGASASHGEEEEEVSSLPASAGSKRQRQARAGDAGAAPAATAAAALASQPASASAVPLQPPPGSIVLPPPETLKAWTLELLRSDMGQDTRELCRQLLHNRLQGQLSNICYITKGVNAALYGLEGAGACTRAALPTGSQRPLWLRGAGGGA